MASVSASCCHAYCAPGFRKSVREIVSSTLSPPMAYLDCASSHTDQASRGTPARHCQLVPCVSYVLRDCKFRLFKLWNLVRLRQRLCSLQAIHEIVAHDPEVVKLQAGHSASLPPNTSRFATPLRSASVIQGVVVRQHPFPYRSVPLSIQQVSNGHPWIHPEGTERCSATVSSEVSMRQVMKGVLKTFALTMRR